MGETAGQEAPADGLTALERQRLQQWRSLFTSLMPFADVASKDLPLSRLFRLSLFQVSCGMAAVLLTGTLNRIMIVELGMPGWIVALMVSIPLLFAPLRALIGFRSDTHRSAFGWRRVPYIWFGTLAQFGGLSIMPFALLIMQGDAVGPEWLGYAGAAIGFLLIGAGMHTTQTAGLALATDLAPEAKRPQVVAVLYVMLLVGMLLSSLLIGSILVDFTPKTLIQVIQGTAAITLIFNVIAVWRQELWLRRDADGGVLAPAQQTETLRFGPSFRRLMQHKGAMRLLIAVGCGAAAFSMQDVLLEPFGGQILNMSVAATTLLTALWALGTLAGFFTASRAIEAAGHAPTEPLRLAGFGAAIGLFAFALVALSAPLNAPMLLRAGVVGIGFGGGLFSVGTLIAAMGLARDGLSGLAIGAWGSVQATAAGLAIAFAGALRDTISQAAQTGQLGAVISSPAVGYIAVYVLEMILLFVTLVVIGPLVRAAALRDSAPQEATPSQHFGLAEFPT